MSLGSPPITDAYRAGRSKGSDEAFYAAVLAVEYLWAHAIDAGDSARAAVLADAIEAICHAEDKATVKLVRP